MQELNIRAKGVRPTLREIQNYRKFLIGTVLVAACAHCIVAP